MVALGIVLTFVVVLAVVAWRERPGTLAYERRRRGAVYGGAQHRVLGGHSGFGAGVATGGCADVGGGGDGGSC